MSRNSTQGRYAGRSQGYHYRAAVDGRYKYPSADACFAVWFNDSKRKGWSTRRKMKRILGRC